jgi:hypothetical protein
LDLWHDWRRGFIRALCVSDVPGLLASHGAVPVVSVVVRAVVYLLGWVELMDKDLIAVFGIVFGAIFLGFTLLHLWAWWDANRTSLCRYLRGVGQRVLAYVGAVGFLILFGFPLVMAIIHAHSNGEVSTLWALIPMSAIWLLAYIAYAIEVLHAIKTTPTEMKP